MSGDALLDKPRNVRDGESFDTAAMDRWLKTQVTSLQGEPAIQQFSGGASNLTYLVSYPDRDLILRRPPFGHKAKGAHDMAREFRVQQALKPVYPAVPTMVALCEDPAVMDCDFYVMERICGIIPRANMPKGMTLTTEQTRQLCQGVIDKLIELHQVDYKAAGLEHLGKGGGYVERQIRGWSDRYDKSSTWNTPGWKYVRDWLSANMPDDVATVIIHNDYRFDNVVLDANNPQKILGVLDWEMATLGDPLMDLGNTLAYWVEAGDDRLQQMLRRQPTHLPGMFSRQQVVDYYCDKMNLKPDNWTFYEVYGLFRLAVIVQQIYYRYHHKQTRNPAFKHFWLFNHYLHWRCKRAIKG
ncbi:MAG: phosphotransferase family protein [Gammaproteobacteria bacterium HGW-Gammaproteobacteria-14]|nr:MAG: phosphotransferase family protein [Gammaproteobacteria bacterium HGW-Gammaproteobacteria-14]